MSKIIKRGSDVIVIPEKNIAASMSDEFRAELKALIQETACDLTLDLVGVKAIDSIGIGIIIAAHNSLKEIGKKLKVINVSEDIYLIFNSMQPSGLVFNMNTDV